MDKCLKTRFKVFILSSKTYKTKNLIFFEILTFHNEENEGHLEEEGMHKKESFKRTESLKQESLPLEQQ